MKTLLGLLCCAALLVGCSGPWQAGTVEEVRVNDRPVAWGVWEKKRHVEVVAVAVKVRLDCGGTAIYTNAGVNRERWALLAKGDRVRVRENQRGGLEIKPTVPCEP